MSRYPPGLSMALAFAAFLASAPITAGLLTAQGVPCTHSYFQLHCDQVAQPGYSAGTYLLLAAATLAGMVLVHVFARRRSAYPAVMLFGTVLLAACAYDSLLRLPVINADKLANDTFNTLRFVVLASFLFLFYLARDYRLRLGKVTTAILISFAAVYFARLSYVLVSGSTLGATRLYLLFLVYAFGGFGVHLMTVSWMLQSAEPREAADAARAIGE